MILRRIFERQSSGFYVDVGAHHPKRFSNTQFFYERGWQGINIDAMPGSMTAFKKVRKRDINIECGVGEFQGLLNYYIFNEPALNGFSETLAKDRDSGISGYRIVKVLKVQVYTLAAILCKNLPDGQRIDFLSIDVEGYDFEVLRSNNWEKFRPTYVLIEILGSSLNDLNGHAITSFMREKQYSIFAKSVNTVFFKNSQIVC